MKTRTIADVLTELVPQKGKNKSEVARRLGISSQLLGQYMNGRHEPKLSFYEAWAREFGEDLKPAAERNVSHETTEQPKAGEVISFSKTELLQLFKTIADETDTKIAAERKKTEEARKETEKILKENNAYLQDLVKSNLAEIEKWSFATLVNLQSHVYYLADKEAEGEEVVRNRILAKQGKTAGVMANRLKPGHTSQVPSKQGKD